MSPALKGALYGLTGFGLFSFCDATIKFLGGSYGPVQIVAFMCLFTLPLIGLQWLARPVSMRPVHPVLMAIRTAAIIGNGLLVTYAFTTLPLAQAYAIFFTLPLILTLMAWPLLGDRVDLVGGVAVIIGLAGVLIALNPGRVEFAIGHLAAAGGVVLAAVHYLIIRKTGGVEAAVPMLFYPVFGQTVVAFLLLPGSYVPMPLADVATFVLLAAGGFAGTLMMIAAYRVAAPVIVAPTQYTQIGWAALFGAVFFDEPMTLDTVLGMGIIAVSGMIVVIRQNRPRTA
jgi:S-adenosylmethionine uptake transporter